MKHTLLLSSALVLALSTGVFAQSSPGNSGDTAGTSVGPATGRPDIPPEPPAAKVQQPGKEGMQAQSAAPGGLGTSVGPAAGQPDVPPERPSAKVQQPSSQQAQNPSSASQGNAGQAGLRPPAQDQANAAGTQDGAQPGSLSGPGHVTTTHELKQTLQSQGFTDIRILAESFVVQAMKDGKRVTMMLGPNGLTAYQIVDEGALNDDEESTGSVTPNAQGSAPQQQ